MEIETERLKKQTGLYEGGDLPITEKTAMSINAQIAEEEKGIFEQFPKDIVEENERKTKECNDWWKNHFGV